MEGQYKELSSLVLKPLMLEPRAGSENGLARYYTKYVFGELFFFHPCNLGLSEFIILEGGNHPLGMEISP